MEFRPLALEDRTAWAALLAVCFDRTPEQMERLLAWFHDGFELVTWSAWDGDRLVAQYNCRLLELEIPGHAEPVPAGMGLNMAVDPAYRGQGLLEKVATPVHEMIAARGCTAGVGFSSAGGLAVTRSSRSYAYDVLGPMASIVVPLVRRRYPAPIRLTAAWPDEAIVVPHIDDGLVRYHVTPASLQHRFGTHPFRRYEFGLWHEDDVLQGLVVFRRTRLRGVRAASLLAAYAVDLPGLLARWAGGLRSTGVHFVHALVSPASPLRAALAAMGPRWAAPVSRNPYHLIVRPLQPDTSPRLSDLQAWDCAGGDIL